MTLGGCPLRIFCSRGNPPRESITPENLQARANAFQTLNAPAEEGHILRRVPDQYRRVHMFVLGTSYMIVPDSISYMYVQGYLAHKKMPTPPRTVGIGLR